MRRILVSMLCACVICATPSSAASPWTAIGERIKTATYFLEALDKEGTVIGSCTGFSINVEKHYVLTAAHCDGDSVRVDGTQSYRMFKDERKDLMVLRVTDMDLAAGVKLAEKNPQIGESVASIGYGFGLEQPMFRIGNVSHAAIEIESLSGPFVMIDANYIPGQSGGPVVNESGELVSIVQRGAVGLGFGVGVETIKDRVGKYFEAPSKHP